MAKTAQAAKDFLNDLYDKIKPIGEKEKDKLMALKKEHCAEQGVPYDDVFYAWDYRFYDRLWTERNLQLDDEKVKEYLPVEHVVPKMMELYEKLLGVQCFPLKDASTWHKEVTAFSVWDKEALEKGEKGDAGFIGFFYLDPYPRPNKVSTKGHVFDLPVILMLIFDSGARSTVTLPAGVSFQGSSSQTAAEIIRPAQSSQTWRK